MTEQNTTPSDVKITDEHKQFLKEAGASAVFLEYLNFSEESVGISRHSPKEEVRSYIFHNCFDGEPEMFDHVGGHFFSALWDGNLFRAWTRADLNNRTLMQACFGEKRIIESGIQNGQPRDYATRLVEEPAI